MTPIEEVIKWLKTWHGTMSWVVWPEGSDTWAAQLQAEKQKNERLREAVDAAQDFIADLHANDTSPDAGMRYQRYYDARSALDELSPKEEV